MRIKGYTPLILTVSPRRNWPTECRLNSAFHGEPGAMLLACTAGGDHRAEPIGWIHEASDRRLRRAIAGLRRARSSPGRFLATGRRLRRLRAGLAGAQSSLGRCLVVGRRRDVLAGQVRGGSDAAGASA